MIVTFEEEYLRELYEKGKATDKKRRFQPQIIAGYKRCIKLLENVPCVESLYRYNGLNYESLKGDKKGRSSIRVNDQYRIEFEVKNEVEPIVTICNILELSTHYK